MALSYSFHISNKGHSLSTINKVNSVSKHNLRRFSKTEIYNKNDIEILVGSKSILDDVKKIYHEEFDECLAKYNAKQKREDRKINNYLDHVSNSRSDVAVEIIIQLGDMDFWQHKSATEKRKMSYLFKDQVKYLTQIMPNFKIASAVIHYDENSPHLHLVGVPIADGYKKGLEKQVAKTKVFTKDSLVSLQDVMRQRIEKGIKLNKDLFGAESLKEKEKGRNRDLPKESLAEFNRLQAQNNDLKRERASLLKDIDNEGETFELLKSCSSTYTKLILDKKSENVALEQEIEKNRAIAKEIEKNRLQVQNEAQKDKEKHLDEIKKLKDQQTQIQKNIDFLKAEEEAEEEKLKEIEKNRLQAQNEVEDLVKDIDNLPKFIEEYKDKFTPIMQESLLRIRVSNTPTKSKDYER